MAWNEPTGEEQATNRIRSMYQTLENYRKTSLHAHGRLIPSVRTYALQRGDEVAEIARQNANVPEVQRWARKFKEYMDFHNLSNDIPE